MINNPTTIDNKIYIAAQLYDGWAVQVKMPGQRPIYAKYTPDGHRTLEARYMTHKQAQHFMNILAGVAKPKSQKFQVMT